MSLSLEDSANAFAKQMTDRVRLLGKEAAKELNKRAGNVAFRSAGFTPKTAKSRIASEMKTMVMTDDGHMARFEYLVINHFLRTGKFPGKRAWTPLWTRKPATGARMHDLRIALEQKAQSTRAYIAAGFLKIASDFGRAVKTKGLSSKGLVGKSGGTLASPGKLVAVLENMARGAEEVGLPAIQKALDVEASDMAANTMEELCKKAGFRG